MNRLPRISIVTPSLNQVDFLKETILSVSSQNYANTEYILIDGGSIDGSQEIIKSYRNRISYWVSEPDLGQAHAINKGLRHATGEILAYLNADDTYMPNVFQGVADYFLAHPEIDCVYGDLQIVDADGTELAIKKAISYDYWTALFGGSMVPQPASFFRRRVIDRIGYFDETLRYNMDTEFFVRCGRARMQFGIIQHPLARFRLHRGSKTMESDLITRANLQLIDDHLRLSIKNNLARSKAALLLRKLFRLRAYLARAITRGQWCPYSISRAMQRISTSDG